jgi:N-acetyl-anhydromuramyl-L-alanine amidase AmpD
MKLNREYSSPNYDPVHIPVEFLVLHYTAGDLESTLALFFDPNQKVSSHLVIAEDGEVYELVRCWDGSTVRAWHAGRSHWVDTEKKWEEFNNFSIGIEIVNLNGNLFPYTENQYGALKAVTDHLRSKYRALNSPHRVIGHEQIAGWRGKVDPGIHFDWDRYYRQNYRGQEHPTRKYVCHPEIAESFRRFVSAMPKDSEISSNCWHAVSHAMETSNRLLQMRRETV